MTTNLHHTTDASGTTRGAEVAVADRPPVAWGAPDRTILQRIEPRFVVGSWALSMLATVVLAVLSLLVVSLVTSTPLNADTDAGTGVVLIVAAMATFIGFVVVMAFRLVRVAHDRLVNSLAVAMLHLAVAALAIGAEFAIFAAAGADFTNTFGRPLSNNVGHAVGALERSAAAAIAACLLAAGMVPAMGGRPSGTQTAATPTDEQL